MKATRHYAKFKFVESDACRLCGRPLRDEDSITIGIGPECIKVYGIDRAETIKLVNEGNGLVFIEGIESMETHLEKFTRKMSARTLIECDKRLKVKRPTDQQIVKILKDCRDMIESTDMSDVILSKTRKHRLERNCELLAFSVREQMTATTSSYKNGISTAVAHADVKRYRKIEEGYAFLLETFSKITPEDGVPFKARNFIRDIASCVPHVISMDFVADGDKRREKAVLKIVTEMATQYGYSDPVERVAQKIRLANNKKNEVSEILEMVNTGNVVGISNIQFANIKFKEILTKDPKARAQFIKLAPSQLQKHLKEEDMDSVKEAIQTYRSAGIDHEVLPNSREIIQEFLDSNGAEWGTKQKWLYKILKETRAWDLIFKRAA